MPQNLTRSGSAANNLALPYLNNNATFFNRIISNEHTMKNKRRDFLKMTGLTGIGLAGGALLPAHGNSTERNDGQQGDAILQQLSGKGNQKFNMSGYAAPKIDTVRIAFIGLGNRGSGAVKRINFIQGIEIKVLCDLRPEKAAAAKESLKDSIHKPEIYTGGKDEWKKVCERDDIDLIYITTPWYLHAPMAVYAMNHNKHVCTEVPAAITLEECWQLVETSEKTRKHCMMLENCCYDFFEMLTLNMARQGYFGEIIHCEGAYIHDLLAGNFAKDKYYDLWRLKQNYTRKGNLYPTHGLGPICQIMDINRGDRMDYLVSVSTNDFMMNNYAKKLAAQDDFYQQFVNKPYNGNMNTSVIRTERGRTIMLQHDVTSPRPQSGIHLVSGSKAVALHYPEPARIFKGHEATPDQWRTSSRHEWLSENEMKALEKEYEPNLVKKVGEVAKQVGGHGGMDFLMDWRTIDCLRNGLPLDQDVYDAALWSSIAPLSAWSIDHRSNSIDVPDFTRGSWKTNKPVDILIEKGGNTKVNA